MCVIIVKEPNTIIPFEKIASACEVNPDGYGISVVDHSNGQPYLKKFKGYNPKGNDVTEIYKIINDHNDKKMFIHLRFATQGKKTEANCHPFIVLDKTDVEIEFMHNGTMSDFKVADSDDSDTKVFCDQVVTPLLEAFYLRNGGDDLVTNKVVGYLLDEVSGSSVFVMYDHTGQHQIIGKGHQHEGWWSSNVYSFNRSYRTPAPTYKHSYHSPYRQPAADMVWDKVTQSFVEADKLPKAKQLEVVKEATSPQTFQPQHEQVKTMGKAVAEAKRKRVNFASHAPPSQRPTFLELSDLDTLEQVCLLDEEEIEEMVVECPQGATLLILDLLHELYASKRNAIKKAA